METKPTKTDPLVRQIVNLYAETFDFINKHPCELPVEFRSPEIIKSLAISAFIQSNQGNRFQKAGSAPAAASNGRDGSVRRVTGIIEQKDKQQGSSAKGPWTRFTYKVDGKWYSTFDKKIIAGDEGDEVRLTLLKKGDRENISQMDVVSKGDAAYAGDTEEPAEDDND